VTARGFAWQHAAKGLAAGAAGIAVVTAAIWALQQFVPVLALGGLYVLAILPVAVVWGFWAALVVALASATMFDFLFVPPLYVLTLTSPSSVAPLVIAGLTAYVASNLADRVRQRTQEAESLARDVRSAEVQVQRFADEQAALRRVAVLVARGAPPEEVFAAVTMEVARQLPADHANLLRYDPGHAMTIVGARDSMTVGARARLGGRNIVTLVLETGRPARIDDYADSSGAAADLGREWGFRAAVGAPIRIEGRLWGVMVAASREEPLPADTEARLAGFTELVATAIANAQARVEVRGFADEQAALRRVATLVARAAPPEEVFAAVTAEVGRLLSCELAVLNRYDPDGAAATVVGAWARTGAPLPLPVGTRWSVGGRNVTTLVFNTGRAARIDDYADATGPAADLTRERGIRSIVGAPVSVAGRLWGFMSVMSAREEPLPADTDARLAGFTELVGTALANADSRAQLTASRARIAAAADDARRRIERDLHDGTQQRLVALSLELRLAQSTVPADLPQLQTQIGRFADELTGALEELSELARGIHPAILSEGGLGLALRTLTRRTPIPVELDIRTETRSPDPIEAAAYYVVSEALTNTTKHAHASHAHVTVEQHDAHLHLSIRDDGIGGADPARGSGLIGLRDRVQALGGSIEVNSRPGDGTAIVVELPLQPD
jgi:signal transduction histidine kinase